ncbi:MAG: ribosomal protein S18-alanine N-acetyltransferase [Candidatus Korobacteraceae bacterium]
MIIRPATPADIPAIRNIERQSDTAAHWGEREYESPFAPDAPPRVALVAVNEIDDALLGFLIARCVLQQWEIENVVVAPEHRRGGIGGKLVGELLNRARQAGVEAVDLEVRESNLAARQLYEKLGFNAVGRRPWYYQNPFEDALLLRISISVP